jgi:hypothetical protein
MATWDEIRAGIFAGESGGDYDALFGYANRPGKAFSGTKLTGMTVDQALAFADPKGPYAQSVKGQIGRIATPMGAYQVVGTTLRAAKKAMGLTGTEIMTPEMQDRIGQWIYKTQGTGAWEGYRGPRPANSVTPRTSTQPGAPVKPAQQPAILAGLAELLAGKTEAPAGLLAPLMAAPEAPAIMPRQMTQIAPARRTERDLYRQFFSSLG